MAQISTQLRKFKEPTKEELTRTFFSLPPDVNVPAASTSGSDGGAAGVGGSGKEKEKGAGEEGMSGMNGKGQMEINAVLSLGQDAVEDSYVRTLSFYSPDCYMSRGTDAIILMLSLVSCPT